MFNLKSYMLKISVLHFEIFTNFAAKNFFFWPIQPCPNQCNVEQMRKIMKMVQLVASLRCQSRTESRSYVEKYWCCIMKYRMTLITQENRVSCVNLQSTEKSCQTVFQPEEKLICCESFSWACRKKSGGNLVTLWKASPNFTF